MKTPQKVGGDDRLSRAGGEGEEHASGYAGQFTLDDLLEGGPDGGVLKVPLVRIGRAVRLEEYGCRGCIQGDASVPGITICQVLVVGKIAERKRPGLLAGEPV